jgi:glucoamylase
VYFTGYRGIVSEVFYPVLDTVNTVDLQFLVGNAAGTFVDEEKLQNYAVTRPDSNSMRWQAVTSNTPHQWRITKNVFTDPDRNTLVLRVTFEALAGNVNDFRLYVLHNPAMDNSGSGDTSKTLSSGGRTLLVASQNSRASALATSRPWKSVSGSTMVSNGFVGVSDGWTDLLGGGADKTMNWTYDTASNGNVAQIGWIDLGAAGASVAFDVVLAFGASESEAMNTANATLGSLQNSPGVMQTIYDSQWQSYASGLNNQSGAADAQYYLAAMSLKAAQDKSNGAMIAGLGTPWGDTNTDANTGGYHLVWPRDLFKFANALVTAGDIDTGSSVVSYLFNTLQQTSDCGSAEYNASGCPQGYTRVGRFPQNAWVSGWQYWQGTQMDEQAMPLLLAWRVYDKGSAVVKSQVNSLWNKMKLTADYIVISGPWTQQDRWEENSGYSPATLAAEIAGLVAAAEFAKLNGDTTRAARYLAAADFWQQNITGWTFTTNGGYGNGRYFIRLNPSTKRGYGSGYHGYDPTGSPNDALSYEIKNGGGTHDQRAIVDGGFLELVRMGIKKANASEITDTLPEYDANLKQTITGKGDAWFRYNCDGYGEHNDGSNFDGTGRGRLWPIFTAERGIYEIAKSTSGASGLSYLNAVKAFSTPESFIPEQVWNITANISGCQVTTPSPYVPGTPSKSIAPLNWAMGEYISLLASIQASTAVDIPSVVCARYNNCVVPPAAGQVSVLVNVNATTTWGQTVYVTGNVTALGNWNTDLGIPTDPGTYPIWKNSVNLGANASIQYKYYRKNDDGSVTWENYPGGGNRWISTPASGTVTLSDSINW